MKTITRNTDNYLAPQGEVLHFSPEALVCTSYNSEAYSDEETISGSILIDY